MREDLKQRLYNAAIRRARNSNYSFSSFVNNELINFINEGVDRMTSSDYASEIRKQVAEDNLMKLIDAMDNDGKRRRIDESLDYTSFLNARGGVCPLWPFC